MAASSTPTSGLLPQTPAAWATDSLLTIPTGRLLRTYAVDPSSSTLRHVASLHGHTGPVTTVLALPDMRLASVAEDATLRVWDVTTGHVLRTLDLADPLLHMAYVAPEQLLCLTSRAVLHVRLVLDRTKRRPHRSTKLLANILSRPTRVVASHDGRLVAVSDATNVHLTTLDPKQAPATIRCNHVITALAITASASILAAADEAGVISLYYNPTTMLSAKRRIISQAKATPSRLHWHPYAPLALAFAHNDTVLLSAGNEAVLVTWRLTPTQFGHRAFLPRLHAPVVAISVSPDESTYALSHADNAVRLIHQPTASVTHTVRAISARLLPFSDRNPSAILSSRIDPQCVASYFATVDPTRHGAVWLPGLAGSVQLFDVFNGIHLDDMHIVPRNVTFEPRQVQRDAHVPPPPVVSGVAAHSSGTVFASADYQQLSSAHSDSYGTESGVTTLRLWRRAKPDQPFGIETVVSQPHGAEGPISGIQFHPHLPILATASSSGKTFKLWRASSAQSSGVVSWRSEIELDYKRLPCTNLSFSDDGSLLAVACGSILTLWNVEDSLQVSSINGVECNSDSSGRFVASTSPCSVEVEFLHALIHPPSEESIESLGFVFDKVPLFITCTRNGVYVWNALAQSIWWSSRIQTEARCLAVDSLSGRFALVLRTPALAVSADDSPTSETTPKFGQPGSGARAKNEATADPLKNRKPNTYVSQQSKQREVIQMDGRPIPTVKKRHRSAPPMDTAVAVFNAASPIPAWVSRLSSGVGIASLAFVRIPGDKKGGPSALVCIDSNLEIYFHGSDTIEDLASFVSTETPAGVANHVKSGPLGKLDMLLGTTSESAKPAVSPSKSRAIDVAENSEKPRTVTTQQRPYSSRVLRDAFQSHLQGPVHMQAPIATKSFDFVMSILRGESANNKQNRGAYQRGSERLMSDEIQQSEASVQQLLDDSQERDDRYERSDKESQDHVIREFCIDMIRKDHSTVADKRRKKDMRKR